MAIQQSQLLVTDLASLPAVNLNAARQLREVGEFGPSNRHMVDMSIYGIGYVEASTLRIRTSKTLIWNNGAFTADNQASLENFPADDTEYLVFQAADTGGADGSIVGISLKITRTAITFSGRPLYQYRVRWSLWVAASGSAGQIHVADGNATSGPALGLGSSDQLTVSGLLPA
jgi:hypothetical protein